MNVVARHHRRQIVTSVGHICDECHVRLQGRRLISTTSPNESGIHAKTTRWRILSTVPIRRSFATASAAASTAQQISRDGKLPSTPARTRFAPSPTGYMHIGGLRTALFSYLLAKKTQGQFLLRIEDTDQKRLVADAEHRLCDDLRWAGLTWDEGPEVGGPYGPYKQSERNHIYQQHARKLLDSDAAFRCFCTSQSSTHDHAQVAYVTSGCYQDCSSIGRDEALERAETGRAPFTIRLRQPPDIHKRKYADLVYGKIQRLKRSPSSAPTGEDDANVPAADTILIKSDGTPTYHFANVVDDHLMKITHVIRGTEWMASTPLHYDLYTAFGWDPPTFAHVGLLLDENKAKLSKRSQSDLVLDVQGMREDQGILPEVLCNFLALLGWSNPGRDDVLEMHELIRDFDLKFTKGNTVVKFDKLWYLQKQHVSRKCTQVQSATEHNSYAEQVIDDLSARIADQANATFSLDLHTLHDNLSGNEYSKRILLADSKAFTTPAAYVERNKYFFTFDPALVPATLQETFSVERQGKRLEIRNFLHRLLLDFDWSARYVEPLFPAGNSASEMLSLDVPNNDPIQMQSARIHAAINGVIWQMLIAKDSPASSSNVHQNTAIVNGALGNDIPFTNKPIDLPKYAEYFASAGQPAESIVKEYKSINRELMKYLRETLTYGMPGPGVGIIMAILGYEECCRRLGIAPPTGKRGW